MRLSKVFTLIEQADPNKTYVIGDSHAVAMGRNIKGAEILAKNGAGLAAIASQAQGVPDGVRVLMTGGANDIRANHNAAGAGVTKIIRSLKNRGCAVVYVAFPPIDLNGEFADVYREAGYTSQYNRVQQATANAATKELGANHTLALSMRDIDPADPMAIHATPSAYSATATTAAGVLSKAKTGEQQSEAGAVGDPRSVEVKSKQPMSDEIRRLLDLDGDGKVTTGDMDEAGISTDVFTTGGEFFGLFDIITNYLNKIEEVDLDSPPMKNAIARLQRQWEEGTHPQSPNAARLVGDPSAGVGATERAQYAFDYFRSKGLNAVHAAGLVGNLQAESGANLNPAAVGDGGKAWGIAQWHPARRVLWEKWKKRRWQQNGSSPDFKQQLDFIVYELRTTESRAMRSLLATTTVADAAFVVDRRYERSAGTHTKRRIDNATAIYRANAQGT